MKVIRTTSGERVFIGHIASYIEVSPSIVQITMVNNDTHNVAVGLEEFADLVMEEDSPHPAITVFHYATFGILVYIASVLSIYVF